MKDSSKMNFCINFKKFSQKDIPLKVKWLNNSALNSFIGEIGAKTNIKKEETWFKEYKKNKNKIFFTIYDRKLPIGFVGLSQINKEDKNAELLVAIGHDDYRGKGVGKIATSYIIDYGFKVLNLHKIKLSVTSDNLIAIKLYKSLGFIVEGELIDEILFKGKFRDFLLMAIFK